MTAYSPLKHGRLIDDPKLVEIGKRHSKTAAQVMLRFQVQRGVIVIPKSTSKERQIENSKIFDFELTVKEMREIEYMNKNSRVMFLWDIEG